jgi:hypothetical protein
MGGMILRWKFRKWDVGAWTESTCLKIGTVFCKGGNEPSGSIKCVNFLTSWEPVSFSRRILFCGLSTTSK